MGLNKRQLILYQDLALVDEGEELIYPEAVFGDVTTEVTDMFNLDTVYVRDSRLSTDYEVIKSAKIYSEMDQ